MSSPDVSADKSPEGRWWSVRAGEYVLGTLRGEDLALFERILVHDTAVQDEVARWGAAARPARRGHARAGARRACLAAGARAHPCRRRDGGDRRAAVTDRPTAPDARAPLPLPVAFPVLAGARRTGHRRERGAGRSALPAHARPGLRAAERGRSGRGARRRGRRALLPGRNRLREPARARHRAVPAGSRRRARFPALAGTARPFRRTPRGAAAGGGRHLARVRGRFADRRLGPVRRQHRADRCTDRRGPPTGPVVAHGDFLPTREAD